MAGIWPDRTSQPIKEFEKFSESKQHLEVAFKHLRKHTINNKTKQMLYTAAKFGVTSGMIMTSLCVVYNMFNKKHDMKKNDLRKLTWPRLKTLLNSRK